MPLYPNVREHERSTTPPRAENPAPNIAVCPQFFPHNDPPHPGLPDAGPNIVVGVQGRDLALQAPTDEHIIKATQRALTYAQHQLGHYMPEAELTRLTETLTQLRIKYSRAEAERLAIADANAFQLTPAQMQRDIQEL